MWFGESWGADVCEPDQHVGTPVGTDCYVCRERVVGGDRGFLQTFIKLVDGAADSGLLASHLECSMLTVIGHEYGLCNCTGYEGMSMRRAGRELMRRVRGSLN